MIPQVFHGAGKPLYRLMAYYHFQAHGARSVSLAAAATFRAAGTRTAFNVVVLKTMSQVISQQRVRSRSVARFDAVIQQGLLENHCLFMILICRTFCYQHLSYGELKNSSVFKSR